MARVLIPLAEGVEEMEAVILIDVFRRAGWRVDAVGLRDGVVTASRGVKLVPDVTWSEIDPDGYDVIALPGGNLGTENIMQDARVLAAVRTQHAAGRWVAAVCAAPLVLQAAGIIDGKNVTCHPLAADRLTHATRLENTVVVHDRIITSQGPGTTFVFALAVIAHIEGKEKAREIARGLVIPDAAVE
ncbi:MAG TPA: DJ-1/PfpI family protein [Kiritimatiellia bacterium]|nr:DJ-1/PfpI family protein [Kiritimatiellia bacterium]HMO99210.1 DJ-1/PfpI family protein [Kiritimatiellia bacterium]HMP96001.1 DJ-1/PfpI family protein [Kiritimatiellia bacterium]